MLSDDWMRWWKNCTFSMFGFTSEVLNASTDVYLRRGKIEKHYTMTIPIRQTPWYTHIEYTYDFYIVVACSYMENFITWRKSFKKCVWFAMRFAHASCNMNEILCGKMLFWFLPMSLFNSWHITEFTVLFTFWLIDCNHFFFLHFYS